MKLLAAIKSRSPIFILAVLGLGALSVHTHSGGWSVASSDGFLPRCWFTSSVVHGKIYVIGGYGDSTLATSVQMFDPQTNRWITLQTHGQFTPRASLASCVYDNKIYVMGGALGPERPSNMSDALEVFDPATNTWSTPKTTGHLTARNNLCACTIGGKIYTFGGYDAKSPGDMNTLEVFDTRSRTWSTPKTTGTFLPHGAFTASLINGKVYVVGGFNDQGARGHRVLGMVQVFDPRTNHWSTLTTKGNFAARLLHAAGVVDGKIYVIGGTPDIAHPLTHDLVQVFDPETDEWSTPTTTGTFTPRSYLSAAVVGNKIYAMGGQDTAQVFNNVDIFTPGR